MKKLILLLLLITTQLSLSAQDPDKELKQALTCPLVYNSVNVITGDYCEAQTDLALSGPHPITVRRCFATNTRDNGPLGTGWFFNHPNLFVGECQYELPEFQDKAVSYEYDDTNRLTRVKTTNRDGTKTFNWIDFNYDPETQLCQMETHDGQHLEYQLERDPTDGSMVLKCADLPREPTCHYSYCDHPVERRKLIERRELPDGRYTMTSYYGTTPGGNDAIIGLPDPLRDLSLGRVKEQLAPVGTDETPIVTHRFTYDRGTTTVHDANGHKKVYRYAGHERLTAIEHYTDENSLYRVEKFFWEKPEAAYPCSKTVEDALGNTLFCETFAFDDNNCLTSHTRYGNLTGSCAAPIEIDEQGRPIDNGVEHYSTHYTYGSGDRPLLVKSMTDNGFTTLYQYEEDTRRLTTKLVVAEGSIQIRQFYLYDEDGMITGTIVDDGYSENSDHLTGVTERRITNLTLRDVNPAMGMPEMVEERVLNLITGVEELVHRTVNHYSVHGECVQQDAFNREGNYSHSAYVSYDAQGRPISTISKAGEIAESIYDANGNRVSVTQTDQEDHFKQRHITYDFANRVICEEVHQPDLPVQSIHHKYDGVGNRTTSFDNCGNATQYNYDALNRLIETRHPAVLDGEEKVIHPTEKVVYDLFDRVIVQTNSGGRTTRTTYNGWGKPIQITHPDGSTETCTYNLDGTLQKSIDKDGNETLYERDFLARITTKGVFASNGELISETHNTYTANHLSSTTDHHGNTSFFSYNAAGDLISTIKQTADKTLVTEYTYDAEGHVKTTKQWYGEGADEFTLTTTERDINGKVIETWTSDGAGELISEIKKEGSTKPKPHIAYDTGYINSRGQHVLTKTVTDPTGTLTEIIHDALGRPETVFTKDPYGEEVAKKEIRYDALGNKVREIHHRGESPFIIAWKYSLENRLEAIVEGLGSPQQKRTTYSYDSNGRLTTLTKPNGTTLTHSYTDKGQLAQLTSSDGTIDYNYSYNTEGHVTQVYDAINATETLRQYTSQGNLALEILGNDLELSTTYDTLGRRTQQLLPDGSAITYSYDRTRLNAIHRENSSGTLRYTHSYTAYNTQGQVTQAKMIGELGTISTSFDHNHRIQSITTPFWSETIPEGGYNEAGQLTEAVITDAGGTTPCSYQYDARCQLTEETGAHTNTFAYDALFNRTEENGTPHTIDGMNQLLSTGKVNCSYDGNGNLIAMREGNTNTQLRYDALDRLTEVSRNGEWLASYSYDAFHRRLTKKTSTENLRFLYDNDREIGAVDASGVIRELRILGKGLGAEIGATVAIEIDGNPYAPVHDHRGNISTLIDIDTGTVTTYTRYSAFGEMQCFDGAGNTLSKSLSPWTFSGKRHDAETGFVYFGKRFYAPSLGRWISRDPLGFADSPNRFAYGCNDPINNLDLYGLFSFSDLWDSVVSFFETVADVVSQFVDTLKNQVSYEDYIRSDVEKSGTDTIGWVFLLLVGFYDDTSGAGVYGEGEFDDKLRITMINGILNTRSYYIRGLEMLSETHGGINIHYVFHATQGWTWDILNALKAKFGFVSSEAEYLAQTWRNMIEEMGGVDSGGLIIHYAHSLGGVDTHAAGQLLTPEERQMIRIITIASAKMLPDDCGFESVQNYISKKDFVYLLDPIGLLLHLVGTDSNTTFLGAFDSIPFIDHALEVDTYVQIIKILGQQFLDEYPGWET